MLFQHVIRALHRPWIHRVVLLRNEPILHARPVLPLLELSLALLLLLLFLLAEAEEAQDAALILVFVLLIFALRLVNTLLFLLLLPGLAGLATIPEATSICSGPNDISPALPVQQPLSTTGRHLTLPTVPRAHASSPSICLWKPTATLKCLLLIDKRYQLDEVNLGEDVPIDEAQVGLRLDGPDQGHEQVGAQVRTQLLSRLDRIGLDWSLHEGTETSECVKEEKIRILGL